MGEVKRTTGVVDAACARYPLSISRRVENVCPRFPFLLQSPSIEPLSAMSQTAQQGQVPPGFRGAGLILRGRNERRNLSPRGGLSPELGTARIQSTSFFLSWFRRLDFRFPQQVGIPFALGMSSPCTSARAGSSDQSEHQDEPGGPAQRAQRAGNQHADGNCPWQRPERSPSYSWT
jgi:hypothetical protein